MILSIDEILRRAWEEYAIIIQVCRISNEIVDGTQLLLNDIVIVFDYSSLFHLVKSLKLSNVFWDACLNFI